MGTFCVGIPWDYYDTDWRGDSIDQSDNPLFVRPKYMNLKEEVLNYGCINTHEYHRSILAKANAYYETPMVHSLKPGPNEYGRETDYPKYEITIDEVISKDRLMSIILYTDFSQLSTKFAPTFRKRNSFEPLPAIKQRHENYYWFSKLLRETVTVYGQNNGEKLGERFFCGMSMMTMPQFSIYLFSPTSTSCHIEVALKFAGEYGIIIEFMRSKELNARNLKGLDVSWLSRYREEDER